jgi:parallel beta-helix repeat protein
LESFCVKMQTDKAWVQGLTLRSKAGGNWYAVEIVQGELVLQDCEVSSAALTCVGIHGADTAPFICGCTIQGGKETGVMFYQGAKGTMEDCEVFSHQGSGVEISDGADPIIRDCRVHGCQKVGLIVLKNGRGTVEDCDIFGHQLSGVQISGESDPILRNCRIRGNKQCGVLVTDSGAGLLEDCTITENGLIGVEIREGGDPTLRRCRIRRNGGVAVKIHTNGKGKVENCSLKNHLDASVWITLIVFTLAFLAWTIYLDSDGFSSWSLVTGGFALLGGVALLGCLLDDKPTGGAVVPPKPVPPPKPAMGGAEGLAALFNKMDDQGAQQMAALFNQMGGGKDKKK